MGKKDKKKDKKKHKLLREIMMNFGCSLTESKELLAAYQNGTWRKFNLDGLLAKIMLDCLDMTPSKK